MLGGLDQHEARVGVSLFRDAPDARFVPARLLDALRQTEVAGEFAFRRKASDVAGGGENGRADGGLSFSAYKASKGGNEVLKTIQTTNRFGKQIDFPIRTEYAHMYLTQRMQKMYNLPNWAVNNRFNVWKINTIQHAITDPYRFRFLPSAIKADTGVFGKYNLFTRFKQ